MNPDDDTLLDFIHFHDGMKFFFVTETGTRNDASENLIRCYDAIIALPYSILPNNLVWISETTCRSIPISIFNKLHVFILNEFEGQMFEYLSSSMAIVRGTHGFLYGSISNKPLNNNPSPKFAWIWVDVVACPSGRTSRSRRELGKLVEFMGGKWTKELEEDTTHLISNSIHSKKYQQAGVLGLKIMTEEWIQASWDFLMTKNKSYSTSEFYLKYRLPTFHNLNFSTTGLPEEKKKNIIVIIGKNGGNYSSIYAGKHTDILICTGQSESDKFKYAVKCRTKCVSPEWLIQSFLSGYAKPYKPYLQIPIRPKKRKKSETLVEDPSDAFQSLDLESNEILPASERMNEDPDITIKTLNLDDNQNKCDACGRQIESDTPHSRCDKCVTAIDTSNFEFLYTVIFPSRCVDPVTSIYIPPVVGSESVLNIFSDRYFALLGFQNDTFNKLSLKIEEFGGIMVVRDFWDISKCIDFLVINCNTHNLNGMIYKAQEIVNVIWLEECLAANLLVDIKYYHRAILWDENVKLFKDTKLFFSNYSIYERQYLTHLATVLGCKLRHRFVRKDKSILICSTLGDKYNKAIQWNLPVASCEWLKDCYEKNKIVSIIPYLVGESKRFKTESPAADANIHIDLNREVSASRDKLFFVMSSTCVKEKVIETIKEQIISLNGSLCDSDPRSSPVTHLICHQPCAADEKFFVIAAGRWLLCPAFVKDSFKAGYFLNEENYEWGNPQAESKRPPFHTEALKNIAVASFHWRLTLQLRSKSRKVAVGIFSDFRFLFYSSKPEKLKQLIECGFGHLLDIKPPYTTKDDFSNVTHCLVPLRKKVTSSDRFILGKFGIKCVSVRYLKAHFEPDYSPNIDDYLV